MTGQTGPAFECQCCGACCLQFSWLSAQPEDILQYADMYIYSILGEADLWIHPETGEGLRRCPFLRKVRNKPMYRCKIYDTRPMACRWFPQLVYDEEGQLANMNLWALDNCPGVGLILQDWTPEQVQALRERVDR